MVGAGKAEGAMDAGNMLKPALARGELHCIGATTLDEYRKYVEKDAALERRFQKVLVDEPSVEATIAILRGLQERYEVHHGVDITDPAIVAAAELSNRYITDRFLPDKAIDLIDEAAARIKMEIDSKPEVDGQARPPSDPAEDRARSGEEGKGRGLEKTPRADRRGNHDGWNASMPTSKKSGKPKRRRCRAPQHIKEEIEKIRAQMARPAAQGPVRQGGRAAIRQAAAARSAAEAGGEGRESRRRRPSCCAPRSAPKKSPKWCRARPASRCRK